MAGARASRPRTGPLPAWLSDLDQVAAGVVEDRRDDRAHRSGSWVNRTPRPRSVRFRVDVVDREGRVAGCRR